MVMEKPHYITTPNDLSGIALTVSSILMTWMILCWIIRVYIRIGISGPFGTDDIVLGIGTVVGTVQSTTSFISIANGFGKSSSLLSEAQIVKIEKTQYVAELLYIMANCLGKCSIALLLSRLTRLKKHKIACKSIVVSCGAWGAASVLAIALQCRASRPWGIINEQCPYWFMRWQIIAAFSIILELGLLAMATWMVWDLHMTAKSKIIVVAAFAFRLPIVAAIGMRVHCLGQAISSKNPFLDGVNAFICTQVAMHYGLMAATIPCLKPFIISFNTGWGTRDTKGAITYSTNQVGRRSSTLTDTKSAKLTYKDKFGSEVEKLRPDRCSHITQISSIRRPIYPEQKASQSQSADDHDVNEMCIHRTVSYGIDCEDQSGARLSDESYYVREKRLYPIGYAQ